MCEGNTGKRSFIDNDSNTQTDETKSECLNIGVLVVRGLEQNIKHTAVHGLGQDISNLINTKCFILQTQVKKSVVLLVRQDVAHAFMGCNTSLTE